MNIVFIRHGMTQGNKEKRYIGRTDEPLAMEGREQARRLLKSGRLPVTDRLFISPMLRCRETAQMLFPNQAFEVVEGLRECGFGAFEGKNAVELENNVQYQQWLNTNCEEDPPGGEGMRTFAARCKRAFLSALTLCREGDTVAFVVHGGTIMALLCEYALPKRAFYEHYVENCGYVRCRLTPGPRLTIEERSLLPC